MHASYWATVLLPLFKEVQEIARLKLVCKAFAAMAPRLCTTMHMTLDCSKNDNFYDTFIAQPTYVTKFFNFVSNMSITISSSAHAERAFIVYRQIPVFLQNVVHLSINCVFNWRPCNLRSLVKCTSLYICGSDFSTIVLPQNLHILWLTKMPKGYLFYEILHGTIPTLCLRELGTHDYNDLSSVVYEDPTTMKGKVKTIIYYDLEVKNERLVLALVQKLSTKFDISLKKASTVWPYC